MADEDRQPKRKRLEPARAERPASGDRGEPGGGRTLSGKELAVHARRQLSDITGLPAEGVTSLERDEDGIWRVNVELLELSRIPSTADLLGSYEVELDERGELLGYRRVRRYYRSQADGE